jgi:anti-sigma-K factor RskA
MSRIGCEQVDELAGAYALGALDADEDRSMSDHLATCDQPHAEARDLIGAGAVLAAGDQAVSPSPGLRDRLMATAAETPQEHRPQARATVTPAVTDAEPRQPWWRMQPVAMGIAAVALLLVIGLGAWGVSLNAQLAERDAALRAVASATTAFAVSGSAGRGWVIESSDGAHFVAAGLDEPPSGQIYELWLLDAEGNPTAVGTVDDPDDLVVVPLEQDLDNATTFAVTVESQRVEAPTSAPVLLGSLEG